MTNPKLHHKYQYLVEPRSNPKHPGYSGDAIIDSGLSSREELNEAIILSVIAVEGLDAEAGDFIVRSCIFMRDV